MAIRSQNIINSDEKWIVTNNELELVSLAYMYRHIMPFLSLLYLKTSLLEFNEQ